MRRQISLAWGKLEERARAGALVEGTLIKLLE